MGLIDFNLKDIGEVVKDIRESITGEAIKDPNKELEIKAKLEALEKSLQNGQIEINKMEASHSSIFIAGWRPFVGWGAGFAVIYYYILAPFLHSFFKMFDINFELPQLDIASLYNLLLALLGVAGLRTYEKIKGVNGNHK